jgi:glycosyltransferase involved in cell wall biosynthesis
MSDIPHQVIDLFKDDEDSHPVMVSIRCITYNQASYIRDALDGFVMQKTDFRFEAIVHDDASTDGTADIIREYAKKYPDIIKPILEEENQWSKHDGSLFRIMDSAMRGKYMAFCEGDDYWIDPLKLQKQVDFMESNQNIGLVYTKSVTYIQEKRKFVYRGDAISVKTFEELAFSYNTYPTASLLLRLDLYRKYLAEIKPETKEWLMGDYPLILYLTLKSKIHYIDDETCVYRVLKNSASHFVSYDKAIQYANSINDIRTFFLHMVYGENYDKIKLSDSHNRLMFEYAIDFKCREKAIESLELLYKCSKKYRLYTILFKSQIMFLFYCYSIPFKRFLYSMIHKS